MSGEFEHNYLGHVFQLKILQKNANQLNF
jgi:hypothetical protein